MPSHRIPTLAAEPHPATVCQVAGHIGAEVDGISLRDLSDGSEQVGTLRAALDQHRVLFFRDQQLDHESHCSLARCFGRLGGAHPHDEPSPGVPPAVHTIDIGMEQEKYGTDFREELRRRQLSPLAGWHTDLTATVNPPAISILRAEIVPAFGGDTQWANLVLAYEELSDPLRRLVDELHAVHRFRTLPLPGDSSLRAGGNSRQFITEHPVVAIHPRTLERVLFVNPSFTARISELTTTESNALLELLFAHMTRPEYTVRWRWRAGDVAIWDNRATAHLAPTDLTHLRVARRMHRVTVAGDPPVGVDGRPSRALAGVPIPPLEGRPL